MRDRRAAVVFTALYAALVAFVAWHHEPWRDEAEGWLLARDASIPDMFRVASYSGQPALYIVLLAVFAKMGLPYATLHVVNVLLATATVAIVLSYAPFSLPVRVAFAFSYFMAFEYAVIARSYTLSVLLLVTAAALHAGRERRAIPFATALALLVNTNVHSFFVGSLLAAVFLFELRARAEARTRGRALAVLALGIGAAVAQLAPRAGGAMSALVDVPASLFALPRAVSHAFLPTIGGADGPWYVGALVAAAGGVALARSPSLVVWVLGSYLALAYVFAFRHAGSLRHYGILEVTSFVSVWMGRNTPPCEPADTTERVARTASRLYEVTLGACLAISCVVAFGHARGDVLLPFSGSKDAAAFLLERDLVRGSVIAAHPPQMGEAVLPHLPVSSLYYPALEEPGSYMKWDAKFAVASRLPASAALELLARAVPAGRAVFLSTQPVANASAFRFRLVYHGAAAAFTDETYFVYLRPGEP